MVNTLWFKTSFCLCKCQVFLLHYLTFWQYTMYINIFSWTRDILKFKSYKYCIILAVYYPIYNLIVFWWFFFAGLTTLGLIIGILVSLIIFMIIVILIIISRRKRYVWIHYVCVISQCNLLTYDVRFVWCRNISKILKNHFSLLHVRRTVFSVAEIVCLLGCHY